MIIVARLITFIIILAAIISVPWTLFGVLAAIVFAIIRANKKDKEQKKKYKKFILISLGGIPTLIVAFLCYFVVSFILSLLGISLRNVG